MTLTIRERSQKVFQAMERVGQQSIRSIARMIGCSKSSVQRHQRAIARRNQQAESRLWESEAGAAWVKRLVLATLFVFGVQRGVGSESLSEFFHLLQLQTQVGVSVSSLRKLHTQMEEQILDYQQQQMSRLAQAAAGREVCASVDETFFEQVILVMLDLPSGFILVEAMCEDYRYETWNQQVQPVLSQLGLKVRYCVSDRGKALIRLALQAMGCPSIADLFHVLRELSRGLGQEVAVRLAQLHQRRQKCDPVRQPHLCRALEVQLEDLQTTQQQYQDTLHNLTLTLHPFAIVQGVPQTSAQVKAQLQTELAFLHQFKHIHRFPDLRGSLLKVEQQLHELCAGVDAWWDWMRHSVTTQTTDPAIYAWVEQALLPALYWHQQSQRTANASLKTAYQTATQLAKSTLLRHPVTATLTAQQFDQWQAWGLWMVSKFQRASSAVEGRNGYLSQLHHNRRGLSQRRLQVLTTIHNFHLKRLDGTTAAERLFGQSSPDLFEWLLQHQPELPLPRRRKTTPKAQPFTLPTVPA